MPGFLQRKKTAGVRDQFERVWKGTKRRGDGEGVEQRGITALFTAQEGENGGASRGGGRVGAAGWGGKGPGGV